MVPAFHPRERGPAELLGRPFPSRGRRSPERRGFGVPSPRWELPGPPRCFGRETAPPGRARALRGDECAEGMRSAGRAGDTSPGHPRVLRHPAWHRGGGEAVGPGGWKRRVPAGLGTPPPTTPRCSKALWEAPCRNSPQNPAGEAGPLRAPLPHPSLPGGPRGAGEAARPPATTPSPAASIPLQSPFAPVQAWGPTAPQRDAPLAPWGGVRTPPTASPRCPGPPTPAASCSTDAAPFALQPSAPPAPVPGGVSVPSPGAGGGAVGLCRGGRGGPGRWGRQSARQMDCRDGGTSAGWSREPQFRASRETG